MADTTVWVAPGRLSAGRSSVGTGMGSGGLETALPAVFGRAAPPGDGTSAARAGRDGDNADEVDDDDDEDESGVGDDGVGMAGEASCRQRTTG
ncbi:MAG: hypothetical protein ACOC0P_02785 [Planctomycetota bacterium]